MDHTVTEFPSLYICTIQYKHALYANTDKYSVSSLVALLCGLAPIPQFGMIIYDKSIRGNTTDYGVTGTYRCLPPYVLIGDARAECTASGHWTKTPECRGMRARKAGAAVIIPRVVIVALQEVLTDHNHYFKVLTSKSKPKRHVSILVIKHYNAVTFKRFKVRS